ncbi:MAG: hypothetical protein FWE57_05175 [Chitinispirillia bacterium]|nr:hypothetical protein [Chitinispirillia bacterium]
MYTIAGYERSDDIMYLFLADPKDSSEFREIEYSDFVDWRDVGNDTMERWRGYIYPINYPPAPKQIVVNQRSGPSQTITAALTKASYNLSSSNREIVHIWDTTAYREQVVINKPNISLISTPWRPNAVIESESGLSISANGIVVDGVNIYGSNAVQNLGGLSLRHLNVRSASGPAIYNSGTLYIDYTNGGKATVFAESGYAVHNTGTLYIEYVDNSTTITSDANNAIYNTGTIYTWNGTISSNSNSPAISNNNAGTLYIRGSTILNTADGSGGVAILNTNSTGRLTLGNNPVITGRIEGFSAGRVSVYTSGNYRFNPDSRKYQLAPANLTAGDVVVVNGAAHINNFELTDPRFTLTTAGNDLVAITAPMRAIVDELLGPYRTIMGAVDAVRVAEVDKAVIILNNNKSHNERVTITMDEITIQPGFPAFDIRPSIRYFPDEPNPAPQGFPGFNMASSNSNIEDNSALRILGAQRFQITGIDIEGHNAVYNTGSATISNSTISAISDYAIYNTGTITIISATVTSASDTAIYNSGIGGSLILGGNPTIIGRIAGFSTERVSVYTSGDYRFNPGNKKYTLAPANLRDGDVVVVGGANYINNFELDNANFILVANGNNLIARITLDGRFATAVSGDTITIPVGTHDLDKSLIMPGTAQNVVLRFLPGTVINFTGAAKEIWAGATGTILGAENLTLSHQVILYNTLTPREPVLPEDRVIGLFSNLCDAIWRGQGGRTIKVGPGVYNFSSIGGQGLIGVMHKDRGSSSILRFGFDDSPPGCERNVFGTTTLIRGMRLEFNGDHYKEEPHNLVMATIGGGRTIFENCIYEARYSDPAKKEVIAHALGTAGQYFGGQIEYRNCVFTNLKTAVMVNDPMRTDQSPVFTNSIFANNTTNIQFTWGSEALCGISSNQLNSIAVGPTTYTGADVNNLINSTCASTGMITSPNLFEDDPGFIDPLISDYRLSSISPLIGTGIGLVDMGMEMVFTFSEFLNGSVNFGQGRTIEFVNGVITSNITGHSASLRFTYTLNLRPVYELKFSGDFISTLANVDVEVWKKDRSVSTSFLPVGYAIWDASVNGVEFANLTQGEFYPGANSGNGRVLKRVSPNVTSPAPVSDFDRVEEDEDVLLSWSRSTERGMSRYKVFRASAAAPHQTEQIASLPADVTEYRDAGENRANYIYSIVAYDSTGNMSAPSDDGSHISGNKIFSFSGFDASVRDTLRVTPTGVTVQIDNLDYLHGAMITVRNRGHNDSLVVEWYGVRDQNHIDCQNRSVNLFGNGAQINNIASPKMGSGSVFLNLRSTAKESYLVDIEIFNWRNGRGCQ